MIREKSDYGRRLFKDNQLVPVESTVGELTSNTVEAGARGA